MGRVVHEHSKKVAHQLHSYRTKNKLTQHEMAFLGKSSQPVYCQIEKGNLGLNLDMMYHFIEQGIPITLPLFGVSVIPGDH